MFRCLKSTLSTRGFLFSRICWFALVNEDISLFFFSLYSISSHFCIIACAIRAVQKSLLISIENLIPLLHFHFNFNFASRHIWATAWRKPPLYMILSPTANITMYNFNNSKMPTWSDILITWYTWTGLGNLRGWKEWKTKCHVIREILECSRTSHTYRWQTKLMQKWPINSVRTKLRICHTTTQMT